MKRCSVIGFLCFAAIFSLSFRAESIMMGLSTEQLANSSDVVIRGVVWEVRSQWSEDGKTIVTRATVLVNDMIKGELVGETTVVEYEGGEVDGVGLKVSDVSPLRRGEDVVLFLSPERQKKNALIRRIVGKAQGQYRIGEDGIARKKGFTVADRKDVIDNNIPVEKLIGKIRAVHKE